MCKYCGTDHDLIGDVFCPLLKRFPESYSTKKVFNDTWPSVLEVDWPAQKHFPIEHRIPKTEGINEDMLRTFKDYCRQISADCGFSMIHTDSYRGKAPQ